MGKYFRKMEAAVFHSAKPQLRYTEIHKEQTFLQEKLTKRLMERKKGELPNSLCWVNL